MLPKAGPESPLQRPMPEVIGIDHSYIPVSDLVNVMPELQFHRMRARPASS
jgi:hypothetical protein